MCFCYILLSRVLKTQRVSYLFLTPSSFVEAKFDLFHINFVSSIQQGIIKIPRKVVEARIMAQVTDCLRSRPSYENALRSAPVLNRG